MGRKRPQLTAELIESTPMPPGNRMKKLEAGGGVYLLIRSGHRYWRMKVRFNRKETTLGLGVYPAVSLEAALDAARDARRQLNKGVNPARVRRLEKIKADAIASNTFGRIGQEFLDHDDAKAPRTGAKHRWLYQKLSALHRKSVTEITAPEIMKTLLAIQEQGQREAAHR